MKKNKKLWCFKWWGILILIIILSILITSTYLILYIYSLTQVSIQELKIEELNSFNLEGFELKGYLNLYNDGFVDVKINHIDYNLILEATGDILISNKITGQKLPVKKTTTFLIDQFVGWKPTSEFALEILKPGDTYGYIQGIVYVSKNKYVDIKIPFEEKINLETYIKQFIKIEVNRIINDVKNTLSETKNNIVEGVNNLINGIIDFFN
ncbi:MAG: hypothetical protein AB7V77_00215 [Candidatus Woesearchaeota archaeon]